MGAFAMGAFAINSVSTPSSFAFEIAAREQPAAATGAVDGIDWGNMRSSGLRPSGAFDDGIQVLEFKYGPEDRRSLNVEDRSGCEKMTKDQCERVVKERQAADRKAEADRQAKYPEKK